MAVGNQSGRDVEYEVEPSNPGPNLVDGDNLWTLLLKLLGLA